MKAERMCQSRVLTDLERCDQSAIVREHFPRVSVDAQPYGTVPEKLYIAHEDLT